MIKNDYLILLLFLLFSQFVIAQTTPVAVNDDYSTEINTTLNIAAPGVLVNDADADGDALTVTGFSINGVSYMVGQPVALPNGEGTIIINADGSFTFTPATGYDGNIPVITYTISDGSSTSFANLNITIINSRPNARGDCDTVEINTQLDVPAPGVLSNDTDANNDPLSVTTFSVNANTINAGGSISIPEGTITINADGSFTFIPTTDYTGNVPTITYCISDGDAESCANLDLTVEDITDLIEISALSSCNQGYTVDGEYKIRYDITLRNTSTARDYHSANLIKNIDLTNDLDAIYGAGCVIEIDVVSISTTPEITNCIDGFYPREFDETSINPNFLNATSSSVFSDDAINNATLYPRQSINIEFCVTVNPFCNGRPNPTPSGSGINFNSIFDVTATTTLENTTIVNHNDTTNLLLTDFHTTEAVVAAALYVEERDPPENIDGTYDFTNTVIITNEGAATANNVNYNMGLGNFLDNGIVFTERTVSQVSGPPVTVNGSYDGDTNTQLLLPNNSLDAGDTIILEIDYKITPFSSLDITNNFSSFDFSQTQGGLDGFNETTAANRRVYSFVTWSDNLGDHLDRYYPVSSPTETASSTSQCSCDTSNMVFSFDSSSSTTKQILNPINTTPNGILEHEEITFQLTITNISEIVQLENLQLEDNLNAICGGNIVTISTPPFIQNSTATTDPILNPNGYNGTTQINIFDGTSGLLKPDESITVQFTVVFNEDCMGTNTAIFSATNPLGSSVTSPGSVSVSASTDTDNDGISNVNDIDDDNDTILDKDEYNGLDPLGDHDRDLMPNYRDTDFGADSNSDGIVDVFDFDGDGVPNHFDLDSDNDGIFDIVEAGNSHVDTNRNGRTNNPVGANGLDNTLENTDTFDTSTNYDIPNTDDMPNNLIKPDFLDIDADGDGIVDNIEAQGTFTYNPPNGTVTLETGIDTAYPNGITPIDTDTDNTPDYIDKNSDNDIRDDYIEGWDFNNDGIAETIASTIDTDDDGLDDAFDRDNNSPNPTNGQVPTDFPNVDNTETPERDWREIIAIVVLINNVSATEGEGLQFTISLVTKNDNNVLIQSTTPIDINFSTTDGTNPPIGGPYNIAIAPYDYNGIVNQPFTIPPFNSTAQFTVTSIDDIIYELNELFTLNGMITSNNTINTETSGIGTILDNNSPPSITMNNSTAIEGNPLEHTITLSHPSSTPILISIDVSDGTATSPDDYIFDPSPKNFIIDGTVDPITNPNLKATFNITTQDDTINELDEKLNVIGEVTSGNAGTQDLTKTGTIIDNNPDPTIVIDNTTAIEGNRLVFTIKLLDENSQLMQNSFPLNFKVQSVDGTAIGGQDFEILPETNVTIPAFTSSITQSIQTIDDRLNENTETMQLQVPIIPQGVTNLSLIFGIGTIKDNDVPNLFSPNGDGKSDVFKISGIEDFPNFKLIIIDRWGSEVYNYSNNGNINPIWWDGTHKGKPVIEGVYFYTLDFNDGSTPPQTNFIQLIR